MKGNKVYAESLTWLVGYGKEGHKHKDNVLECGGTVQNVVNLH